MGKAGFWLWYPALPLPLVLSFEAQTPEKSFLGKGRLSCSLGASNTGHTLPQLCSPLFPWIPGHLSGDHPLELLLGVEVMDATLYWPKHVFGEGVARATWPSLWSSSVGEAG